MTILKHQIVVHPDLAGPFASERSITPYERQDGFSWYLCPVVVADKSEWLLVNAEFGYCEDTGEEIGLNRLQANPVARLTIEAQQHRELKGRFRG